MTQVVERLAELAEFGKYEGGIDRGLATPQERQARELFAKWARDAGYHLTQDPIGNLFARRNGTIPSAAPILVGSHLDTVPTGGAYDGAYGVVAALCALEQLDREGVETKHPVEAVAWVGEEGSRFPIGCLGSAVFARLTKLDEALALRDENGLSLGDALASSDGGRLDLPQRGEQRVAAYLELHVEQGPVLEAEGVHLGVVSAITGQIRYRAVVEGTSGHAGTVPMDHRSDALSATAEIVLALEAAARKAGGAVVTVGRLVVEPGGTNVIPARVSFSIDNRSPDAEKMEAIEAAFHKTAEDVSKRRGVRVVLEKLDVHAPTPMNAKLREGLHRVADAMGQRALDIPSGAGHDAMCIAKIAPAAMLFVPSIGGHSHVGQERTADDDLELGVAALARAIAEVDAIAGAN
jgi:hydantoinase/carbamoylase family amidase